MIRAHDEAKAVVMVGPDDADLQEADDIPQVRRPLSEKRIEKGRASRGIFEVRHPNINDEKCDRDGEHAVTESLDPARIAISVLSAQHARYCVPPASKNATVFVEPLMIFRVCRR